MILRIESNRERIFCAKMLPDMWSAVQQTCIQQFFPLGSAAAALSLMDRECLWAFLSLQVCSSSFYPDNHGLPCMFNKLFKLGEFGHFYFRWFGFCFLTQTFSRFKVIISIYFGGCSEQHHGGVRAVCRCLRLPRRVSPDGSDPWESPEPLSADCRCHFRRAVYFHHFTQEFSFISSHVHFSGDAELLFKDTLAPRAITVSGRVSLNICRASGRFSILRGSPSQQRGV